MLSDAEIRKYDSQSNIIAELVDEYRDLKEAGDKCFSALDDISAFDAGILSGDESWTVEQWHDYIRSYISEVQKIAKEVL